jgi:hypothetical protein
MSKTIRNNLLLAMMPLLIFEGVFGYLVIRGEPRWFLFIPVSLLTLLPTWGLQDLLRYGWNDRFLIILAIVAFDIVFLGIMAFSITRNHKIIGGVCLFVFIFLSIVVVAGGS